MTPLIAGKQRSGGVFTREIKMGAGNTSLPCSFVWLLTKCGSHELAMLGVGLPTGHRLRGS
jgi:hypothetical protein